MSIANPSPLSATLQALAIDRGLDSSSAAFAKQADAADPLSSLRSQYHLPLKVSAQHSAWPEGKSAPQPSSSEPAIYLCGNSLGPLPKRSKQYVIEDLDAWGTHAVLGHFNHPIGPSRQWTKIEEKPARIMSDLVGAKPSEVTICNTLTSNLHTLLATFYRPATVPDGSVASTQAAKSSGDGGKVRHKILHERSPFPSDQYALGSVVELNGRDPDTSLVPLSPRENERVLRTEDILSKMEEEAATGECWGILLGSTQYLTGQAFELGAIAAKARELGIFVAFDLAHAFANIPLALHDWGVDFAVWCTYKYGSSGPGGIAGMFVHEKWNQKKDLVRPSGWWGHNKATRFAMPKEFDPISGAAGWQQSNPSSLDMSAFLGSLETLSLALEMVGTPKEVVELFGTEAWATEQEAKGQLGFGSVMPLLRSKSEKLTGYLEHLLFEVPANKAVFDRLGLQLITPHDPTQRGSQLTVRVPDTSASEDVQTDAAGPVTTKDAGSSDASAGGSVAPPTAKTTMVARLQQHVEEHYGVIADIRNPDVIRLAPLAQYNTFTDVWTAVEALKASAQTLVGGA